MKNTVIKLILSAAMAATAALLLAGFQERNGFATGSKEQIEAPQVPSERSEKTVEDTAPADTMEIFRERMQRWNLLHESCLSKPDK